MKIQVLTGAGAGAIAEVAGERFVIGQGEDCDLVVPDRDVARRHVALERAPEGRYVLRDLRSRGGTYVNGRRVRARVPLRGTEVIRLGRTTLQVSTAKHAPRMERTRRARRLPASALAAAAAILALGAGIGAVLAVRGADQGPGANASTLAPTIDSAADADRAGEAGEPPQAGAGAEPSGNADAPRGSGLIAFEREDAGEPGLVLMNADGIGSTRLPAAKGAAADPALSPDGARVAYLAVVPSGPFVGADDLRLYVAARAGGRPTELLDPRGSNAIASGPAWSPDARHLAVAWAAGGIAIVPLAGGEPTVIGSGPVDGVAWSPDGSRIALAARVAPSIVVVGTVAPGGADPKPLATIERLDRSTTVDLDWSPDGSRIALTCRGRGEPARAAICVMNADGTDLRVVADGAGANADPSWSPDGRRIAFVSDRDGNDEIYTMDGDGNDQTRLTFDPAPNRRPSWAAGAALPPTHEASPIGFRDGFSNPATGWEVFAHEGGSSAEYEDGAFVIRVPTPGTIATADSGRPSDRADVAVTARLVAQPSDAGFGILCGFRDQENFYRLGIRPNGTFAIVEWLGGVQRFLTGGGLWAPSEAIPPQAGAYRLEAACSKRRLSLSVDGRRVVTVTVADASGTFGLYTETSFEQGGAHVRFDDLVAMQRPGPA